MEEPIQPSSTANLRIVIISAARVDLAQFETIILEENSVYTGDSYNNLMTRVSNDLRDGIEGLSVVMEHFSANCHIESFPLSVSVFSIAG